MCRSVGIVYVQEERKNKGEEDDDEEKDEVPLGPNGHLTTPIFFISYHSILFLLFSCFCFSYLS